MNVIYDIPSDDSITKCLVTKEAVENGGNPEVVKLIKKKNAV